MGFFKTDIVKNEILEEIFEEFKPEIVINLAAQAGLDTQLKTQKLILTLM